MNKFISIILSLADELIFHFRPSNRKGFISVIFIIAANSLPVYGVIFFKWNPYMILLIYWGESLIIGIFNILKMLISGVIENGRFSPSGSAEAAGLSLFFTFHYGMFMFVHGIFIIVFMFMSLTQSITTSGINNSPEISFILEGLFPEINTVTDFLESEYAAVAALFISHLVSFYLYFIKTGEYNYTQASTYMMRPYKRIIIMHMTIIFGAFALFISGFKSAVFIIIWIGLKILSDLKIHITEVKKLTTGQV